jgi:TonB family protein
LETPSRKHTSDAMSDATSDATSRSRSLRAAGRTRGDGSFGERQRARRSNARRLVVARTKRPLTGEQLAFDPLERTRRSTGRRLGYALLAVLASAGVHLGAVGVGLVWRASLGSSTRHEDVTIEMRQPPPPPPPPEKKPPPEPPPPIEKPTRAPPKVVKAPPPPPATPTPPPKAAPMRVVGLNLESTTEGGEGPAFAVGNTRLGETDAHARAPKDIGPPPSGTSVLPAAGPGKSNQIATHIPVAGIEYTNPKPRGGAMKQPDYPPLLRSQSVEGRVGVLVTISETGKVTAVKILNPSPYPEFNEAARRAALAQDWEPATRAGVPMARSLTYTYKFDLNDE